MYSVGDVVQPKQGGPKMTIVEINGDTIVAAIANDTQDKKYTFKAEEITPYAEDGDFGVC